MFMSENRKNAHFVQILLAKCGLLWFNLPAIIPRTRGGIGRRASFRF